MRVDNIVSSGGANTVQVNGITVRNMGSPDAVLEDQKPSGTVGQTLGAATWDTRQLNTIVRNLNSLVSLSSNQFTVSANCWCECSHMTPSTTLDRIWNVTDNVAVAFSIYPGVLSGQSGFIINTMGAELQSGKTYRIESNNGKGTASALGTAHSLGTNVYTRVKLWRL